MITEKGKLLMGVEHGGRVHRDFELRPQLVRDSVEAMEEDRARLNDAYCGVCIMAKTILSLGDIPKSEITPDLVMSLTEVDSEALVRAKGVLEGRLRSFREPAT
jgi:hypothetical protein